ncbi:MAG: protein kinase family protein [Clostridiales bacterium]|nr:protein kinase family protein [Clostridiales bacterium]
MFILQGLEAVKAQNRKDIKHPDALPADTMLCDNRYSVISLEDVSDRAFLYKAYDTVKDRYVCIKEFFPKDAFGIQEELYFVRNLETHFVEMKAPNQYKSKQFKNLIDGFVEEAKYLEKISYGDPVLRILDAFEDYGTAYIVSNYNQWPSLQDFLDIKYRFSGDELEWMANQLVDSIMRFHKRKIIHRNINPKNIYLKPGQLIVDSIGTCDFLQDIKLYDNNDYQSKYHAPEILIHNGVIGTWTDVYAIGKVLIDIISMMTESEDYFTGLETLSELRQKKFETIVKHSIAFNHKERLIDAIAVKKELMYEKDTERTFKTPKSMIAAIAMISFLSCALLIWQYQNDTMMANDYYFFEEEEVPLGSVSIDKKECYFITKDFQSFEASEQQLITWFASGRVSVSHMEISDDKNGTEIVELSDSDTEKALDLSPGKYQIKLYYKLNDEVLLEIIHIEIIE